MANYLIIIYVFAMVLITFSKARKKNNDNGWIVAFLGWFSLLIYSIIILINSK